MNIVFGFGYKETTEYCRNFNFTPDNTEIILFHQLDFIRGRIFNWETIHVTIDPLELERFVGKRGVKELFYHLSLLKSLCCKFYDESIYNDYVFYVENIGN